MHQPGVRHLRVSEGQLSKICQCFQMRQTGVGHLRLVEIQPFEAFQFFQMHQPFVRHFRAGEDYLSEPCHSFQMHQALVRHLRAAKPYAKTNGINILDLSTNLLYFVNGRILDHEFCNCTRSVTGDFQDQYIVVKRLTDRLENGNIRNRCSVTNSDKIS